MSYAGYLLKVGGTILPNKYIKLSSYDVTPNQRMEVEASRDATGELHRCTCPHTASKIVFNTPYLRGADVENLNALLGLENNIERNVQLEYFDTETQKYKQGKFYIPDTQYSIHCEKDNDLIYKPIRYAFIEY